jgi:hypothetical protein
VKAFFAYGVATGVLLGGLALGVLALVAAAEPAAVGLAAGLAWVVQLVAFAVLVKGRKGSGFVVGWAVGMALRFGAVAAAAIVVTRSDSLDPATALVSLVGFVFVLVLLEPLFLRLAD